MTNKDRAILKQGSAMWLRRNGNQAEWQVYLACEPGRSSRTVSVHAMSSDCTAIKAALAQRDTEQRKLATVIFGGAQ